MYAVTSFIEGVEWKLWNTVSYQWISKLRERGHE